MRVEPSADSERADSERADSSRASSLSGERIVIVGRGRVGTALTAALSAVGVRVELVAGRSESPAPFGKSADIVLLAVPDAAIAETARRVDPGRLVGHLSGATDLTPLAPHDAFSLHPLQTITGMGTRFDGVHAAIAGVSERAEATARALAQTLGMQPFVIDDAQRAAYHASACVASNFLLTLENFAEQLASAVGMDRAALVPLVQETVENWAKTGAATALTGPIARGDEETVARHREAIAREAPAQLPLFDALAAATRELAASTRGNTE